MANKYYQKNTKKDSKKKHAKYENISEEEKDKNQSKT